MRKCLVLSLMMLSVCGLFGQQHDQSWFLGINPNVTLEPFYQKGEFDFTLVPLIFQFPLAHRLDVRFNSIVNLGIRKTGNRLSHYGLETALPFFIRNREEKGTPSKGFYFAPVLSFTRNSAGKHTNAGLWLEPGYSLLFNNRFALTFGIQAGTTYFDYDYTASRFRSHFGVKVIFGKWI